MLRAQARVEPPAELDRKLTDAQELMVDLLVARHRLGEPFWPVSTRFNRTYSILREKGYVEILDGNVENTVRLMLTRKARKKLIEDSSYVTPIERQTAEKIAVVLEKIGGDPTTIRMIRRATIFGNESGSQ